MSIRDFVRNLVFSYLPSSLSHWINIQKNLRGSFLEPEMGKIGSIFSGKSDAVAVDVGANLGLYCELLSPHFREVIAIEPQARLATYLTRVVPRNVRVIQLAASDHDGEAKLHIPLLPGLSGAASQQDALASLEELDRTGGDKPAATVPVRLSTIDAIVGEAEVAFIKIDVEGHETAAVRGALGTIERCHPILLIEISRQMNADVSTLFGILEERGYSPFYVSNNRFVPVSRNDLEIIQSDNDYQALMNKQQNTYVANFFFFPSGSRPPQS